METIRNYLDNMLAAFPTTPELMRLKEELLSTMEDKYNELKEQGRTENEAVGIVISEFGNIEELMQEMGILTDKQPPLPTVDRALAVDFIAEKKHQGLCVALGVMLCILAPAVLIAIPEFSSLPDMAGLVGLFVLVAIAVCIFIQSGFRMEKYKFLEREIYVPADVTAFVRGEKERFASVKNMCIIAGILLILLAPVCLIVVGEMPVAYSLDVVLLLVMVALGVFCLITAGNADSAYNMLLQTEDFTPERKEANKAMGAVAAVWWPCCVAAYLLWSFLGHAWHISWVIWPVAGILFGAFSAAYSIKKGGQ